MRGFHSPARIYFSPELMWRGTADRLAQGVIDVLISGKFITLFSFLFGLGFAVQLERAELGGARLLPVYCRRLGVLLLIGLAHAFLVWWGDILLPYALLGFLLLLFRRRSQKTVMIWAWIGLWFPVLLVGLFVVLSSLGVRIMPDLVPTREVLERTVATYAKGGFSQILAQRAGEVAFNFTGTLFFSPKILGMFLLGFYVWRRGLIQRFPRNLPLLHKAMFWGLLIGLAGNLAGVLITVIWRVDPIKPSLLGLVVAVVMTVGVPALSCFYASAIGLLFQQPAWQKRLAPFAAVGRTALSNYLLQSVVCTMIFYSYGFGLYGRVGPAAGLIPTVLLYPAQLVLSVAWLRRYPFGPMEWLWRTLTYGRAQSMRVARGDAAQA